MTGVPYPPNPQTDVSDSSPAARPTGMRNFKYDVGDWIAVRDHTGQWKLAGKVVDADSESCRVEYRGLSSVYLPGEDPIARVRWRRRGQWELA